MDARKIGKELNVGSLLEGQVLRSGNKLRISTQLTDSNNGLVLWRNSYQREMKDVFAVHADIAKSIASALKVTLSDAKPMIAKTENTQAHDLYLRGRFEHEKFTEEGIRRAIALYDSAIALDPKYVDPRARLATAWMNLADDWLAPKEAVPHVLAAAKAALELDSTNAAAYLALVWGSPAKTAGQGRRSRRKQSLRSRMVRAFGVGCIRPGRGTSARIAAVHARLGGAAGNHLLLRRSAGIHRSANGGALIAGKGNQERFGSFLRSFS
jgi:hypothetical protein